MTSDLSVRSLSGVIDIHCHSGPDSLARSIDAVDLAHLAKKRGMRAIVLKNHYESTASLAYMARKAVPGIEIFGGITLNLSVGGMNPHAIDHMAKVSGGAGRFVWMGSFDTEAQVRYSKHARPCVSLSRGGKLLPEVESVIDAIARHHLILETGHSTSEEVLMLIREARGRNVRQIVVTHAMIAPIHIQPEQMKEAVANGAWIEFVYNGLIGKYKEFEFSDYARAIRTAGIDKCVLSSDLGQPENPPHPDGLVAFFDGLEKEGFTSAEIDVMSKTNPALILGLD
jgi:hypothetical protein